MASMASFSALFPTTSASNLSSPSRRTSPPPYAAAFPHLYGGFPRSPFRNPRAVRFSSTPSITSMEKSIHDFSAKLKVTHLRSEPLHFPIVRPFAAQGDITELEELEETESQQKVEPSESEEMENGVNNIDTDTGVILASLQSYKNALVNGDQSTIDEIETLLVSIEDEKNSLEAKVVVLSQESLTEKERILRISADFDNFRKRTERERLSLMTNVQGEVIESLLPVLDNFERAKTQIKVETEGEEKINNSYQSIYKQFVETLTSLGVEAVETVGNAFDPLLHEAIMREESTEFEEGIVIQEFRKGFKLGERLLRPSMVKVSAGPGPTKSAEEEKPSTVEDGGETSQKSREEGNNV